jgi:hypothetical protein
MKLLLHPSHTPLLFLVKAARGKVPAGQMALAWDEEAHPRAASGSHEGGHHGGEFVKKEDAGTPVENGPSYRSKFTGLEFTVTHKKEPEQGGHLPVYTGTVTKQGTGGFSKFKVGDRHSASAIQIANHYERIDGDPLGKPEEKGEDPNVLHTFTNEEEGVKSVVARYSGKGGGFIVSLHDTDAGEPVGYGKIYTVEGEAVKQAREWAKVPEPTAETPKDPTVEELRARYKPGNPFADKAATARANYNRLSKPTAHDQDMAKHFPLGVGYGGAAGGKRVEATIDNAVKAGEHLKEAQWQEARAEAFDRGDVNAQGRRPAKDADQAAERREALKARFEAAQQERQGKERWQVRAASYADSGKQFGGNGRKLLLADHRGYVEAALAAGLPVPADVLADYPDLKAPAAPEAPIYDDTYTGPRFTYGGQNRPLGYAAIPKGHIPGSNREHGSFRHGTVDYPRELTPEEAGGFELERVYSDGESGGMSPEQHQTAAAWIEDYKKEIPTMERGDKDMMVEVYRAHKKGPAALREYLDTHRNTNYYADALADQLNLPRLPNLYLKKAKRSVPAGQTGFDFDAEPAEPAAAAHSGTFKEEDHPRAPSGSGGTHHGGEFIKKEDAGGANVGGTAAEASEAAEEESLRPAEANYKYRDTGYIPGSRKELAATQIRRMAKAGERVNPEDIDWDELETNPREAESLITKANIFGASSFDEMEERGVEPGAAFLIQKIYASVAPKPEDSGVARRNYVAGIATLRDKLEECKTVADVEEVLAGANDDMTGIMLTADQQAEYQTLREESRRLIHEWSDASDTGREDYNQMMAADVEASSLGYEIEKRRKRKWAVDPEMVQKHAAAKANADKVRDEWAARQKVRNETTDRNRAAEKVIHHQLEALKAEGQATNERDNPLCGAFRALGDSFWKVVNFKRYRGSEAFLGHYTNAKAGRIKDYGFAKGDKKVKTATRGQIRFRLQVSDNVERTGGRPMAADSTTGLKSTFGLRDVQSGEWVLNDPDSAKFHVENTATALQDLADVLGMADHETGFNGRLGLAFGARGQGLHSASAHYERVHRVINLTKMHGAGSLAHEWWHAFDNLIHEAATGTAGKAAHYVSDNTGILPQGELRDRFSQLMQFIDKSAYKKEAEKIDRTTGRATSYWSNPNELTARAFAAFVEDHLERQGRSNTYLTAMNDNRYYDNPLERHADGEPFKPCPEGKEREILNTLMAELFHVANAEGTIRKALETLEIRLLLPVQAPPTLFLKAMALCKDCHSLLTPGEAQDGRCMGCQEAHELSKAANGKPMPGQMAMSWDEDAHPRAPAGSDHGGEFVKKDEAPAAAPEKKAGGKAGYAETVEANLKHMGTERKEWSAVGIKGFAETDGPNGKPVMMPEFEFPLGYASAPSMFADQDDCCGLCGTSIKNYFWIQNDEKKWTLGVGSECVKKFSPDEKSGADLAKEARWVENRAFADQALALEKKLYSLYTVRVDQGYGRIKRVFNNNEGPAATCYRALKKLTEGVVIHHPDYPPDNATVTRWVNKNGAEVRELMLQATRMVEAKEAATGARPAANQGDTHQPLGHLSTPERPVGSKETVTEVPSPVLLYRQNG